MNPPFVEEFSGTARTQLTYTKFVYYRCIVYELLHVTGGGTPGKIGWGCMYNNYDNSYNNNGNNNDNANDNGNI